MQGSYAVSSFVFIFPVFVGALSNVEILPGNHKCASFMVSWQHGDVLGLVVGDFIDVFLPVQLKEAA